MITYHNLTLKPYTMADLDNAIAKANEHDEIDYTHLQVSPQLSFVNPGFVD